VKSTLYSRIVMVGLGSLLLLSVAVVVTNGLRADQQAAIHKGAALKGDYSKPLDSGTNPADAYTRMPVDKSNRRTLAVYYNRRASEGAPPVMPHQNFDPEDMDGRSCLGCHRDGGYVTSLKAFAPITPHPDMGACSSCHVPQTEQKSSNFAAAPHPVLKGDSVKDTPPNIPHSLEMRSNCLACHASSATPAAIRCTHPDRGECTMCHTEAKK